MTARLLLFGGTFDPIHDAHLEIARAAVARFGFRKVLFVPAANPPHKAAGEQAPYVDRLRMVELACAADPLFEASSLEEGEERSYSILTIEKLLAAGEEHIAFLIGADAFADIASWHRWRDVVRLVEFVVVARPGADYAIPEGARVSEIDGIGLPISSSEIRDKLSRGEYDVPLPPSVVRYIRGRGLYR